MTDKFAKLWVKANTDRLKGSKIFLIFFSIQILQIKFDFGYLTLALSITPGAVAGMALMVK